MMNTTANYQMISKLRAIDAAEQYLISRTRHEIRAGQANARTHAVSSNVLLASSAACVIATLVLLQIWPLIAPGASI